MTLMQQLVAVFKEIPAYLKQRLRDVEVSLEREAEWRRARTPGKRP